VQKFTCIAEISTEVAGVCVGGGYFLCSTCTHWREQPWSRASYVLSCWGENLSTEIGNSVITLTWLVKGFRSRGRPKICWCDNITAWTGFLQRARETAGVT